MSAVSREAVAAARQSVNGDRVWCDCYWYANVDHLCTTHEMIALALDAFAKALGERLAQSFERQKAQLFSETEVAYQIRARLHAGAKGDAG